jgi:hypothetical protein
MSSTQQVKFTVQGKFKIISEYKKLVIEIDEATYNSIKEATREIQGHSALHSYEHNGELHYTLSISLDSYDKLEFNLRKLAAQFGRPATVTFAVKPYEFTDRTGAQHRGWAAKKVSFFTKKPSAPEPTEVALPIETQAALAILDSLLQQ